MVARSANPFVRVGVAKGLVRLPGRLTKFTPRNTDRRDGLDNSFKLKNLAKFLLSLRLCREFSVGGWLVARSGRESLGLGWAWSC